jgi:acyl carrier protein
MDDVRTRLMSCFAAVFPDLPAGDIERATPFTVAAWDSVANVTLITVIEEEFGVQIPAEDLDALGSFELLLDYLRTDLSVR